MVTQELCKYKNILSNIFYVPSQCCEVLTGCPSRCCQVVRTCQFKFISASSSLNMNPSRVIIELSSPGAAVPIFSVISEDTEFAVGRGFEIKGDWGGILFVTASFSIRSFSSQTYLITSVLVQVELFTPSSLHWCAQLGET